MNRGINGKNKQKSLCREKENLRVPSQSQVKLLADEKEVDDWKFEWTRTRTSRWGERWER